LKRRASDVRTGRAARIVDTALRGTFVHSQTVLAGAIRQAAGDTAEIEAASLTIRQGIAAGIQALRLCLREARQRVVEAAAAGAGVRIADNAQTLIGAVVRVALCQRQLLTGPIGFAASALARSAAN